MRVILSFLAVASRHASFVGSAIVVKGLTAPEKAVMKISGAFGSDAPALLYMCAASVASDWRMAAIAAVSPCIPGTHRILSCTCYHGARSNWCARLGRIPSSAGISCRRTGWQIICESSGFPPVPVHMPNIPPKNSSCSPASATTGAGPLEFLWYYS